MANLALGYLNTLAGTVPTANNEDLDFPATNATNGSLAKEFRAGATDATLTVDHGASGTVSRVFAVLRCSGLMTDATVAFLTSTSSGFGTPVVDTGATSDAEFDTSYGLLADWQQGGGRNFAYVHGSDVTQRYVRTSIVNSASGTDVRIGLWWVGPIWQAAKAPIQRSPAMTFLPNGGVVRRRTMEWNTLTAVEAAQLEDIAASLGGVGRVLLVPQSGVLASYMTEVMLCVIESISINVVSSAMLHDGTIRYAATVVFREVSR